VDAVGPSVEGFALGQRVGIPGLGHTCGQCWYCRHDAENLCDAPQFTGYTRPGGYAERGVANARFAFGLGKDGDDVALAPLLCAGLIGRRSLVKAGPVRRLGLYGFGAAAHIVMQVARWQGRATYAFSRPGDLAARTSPARSARSGPSARTSCRPSRWMRRSSTRRPASWCRRSLAVWSRKAPEARHPAS
jgi:propanol-preferring alcohol dehydrogenase